MIKVEQKPYLIVLILFGIHYLSGYPGGMSPDTFDQFGQSLALKFNSHHPPVMAMVWAMFHKIYPGPQTMLFFHLALLWGGVLLLYHSDPSNKYRWMYFVIPFIPNVLSQSTMIWKDIGFGLCFFFVVSVCIYYTYKERKAPLYLTAFLFLITFYGMAIKFQAQFIIPFLVYWVVQITWRSNIIARTMLTILFSAIILYANSFIIGKFSTQTNSWQLRQVFDIAGIVYQTEDEELFPQYIRESEMYSLDKVKKHYTPKWVDTLFFDEDTRIFAFTFDENNLASLDSSFKNAVSSHPFRYMYHRLLVLSRTFSASKHTMYGFISHEDAKSHSIHFFRKNLLKKIFTKYNNIFPSFLTASGISFLMILFYLIVFIRNSEDNNSKEFLLLRNMSIISLAYTFILLFTTMSSDYRYYYLVRLLSFFALPIYLNLREKRKV